jgi:hypothetical protein
VFGVMWTLTAHQSICKSIRALESIQIKFKILM